MHSTFFLIVTLGAIAFESILLFLALFEPDLEYQVKDLPKTRLNSPEFLRLMELLTDSQVQPNTEVEVLTNGEAYFAAELEAIREARDSIHLEAYIFQRGKIARQFIEALAERARAGVKVRLVLDALGSFLTTRGYLRELIDAGGEVHYYHPFRWHMLPYYNNRTHRELIIIDGKLGFIGGSGIADHWLTGIRHHPRWRDTMFRVRGGAVAHMQAAFAENWLEASGEILAGETCYEEPDLTAHTGTACLIVNSSPSAGRGTRARILFQTLLACAQKSIHITTPYFLPDASARKEICRAIRERGVEVKIILPGHYSDHLLTRRSSRRLYGDLLKAGARIFEYEPAMIHAKSLVIDGLWSVVGSTNFDHRSFGLNDEVNLAACCPNLASRLAEDFARDLTQSKEITFAEWHRRPIWERVHESVGSLLERQE